MFQNDFTLLKRLLKLLDMPFKFIMSTNPSIFSFISNVVIWLRNPGDSGRLSSTIKLIKNAISMSLLMVRFIFRM